MKLKVSRIQLFSLVLVVASFAVLFILTRMQNVELSYKYGKMSKRLTELTLQNKDLKAKKAKLLSSRNLTKFAKNLGLKEPRSNQIIVIKE